MPKDKPRRPKSFYRNRQPLVKGEVNLDYGMLSILALLAIIGWVYLIKK